MRNLALALMIVATALPLTSCIPPEGTSNDADESTTYKMINNIMDFIKDKHPDAVPFIKDNASWSKTSADRRVGYTRFIYTSGSWRVTLGHAITAEVVYEVKAEYENGVIIWNGIIKDNIIAEQSYVKK